MAGFQKDGGGSHADTPAPTAGTGTQRLQVTPENVVELAVTFRQIADLYEPIAQGLEYDLLIKEPWLGDPFSQWAKDEFNNYFVKDDNSLVATIRALHKQQVDTFNALKVIADQYGKTEELNKQLMQQQEQTP
ncbi:hypothetical protein [Labedaea rhizosphaerae]|uniref:PE family protein n=1 Tax=Labedaea rhizosphaerae TaxID=598644 RepID=A0A4V3D0C4_LABRH|nr:hypothetical protein [Labedaea rhizosphaerae]TDQ05245.1 hypothetical protein EV186_1011213 [Labedaea rhizosphaerae]